MFLSRRDSEAKEQEVPCSKQQRAYQDGGVADSLFVLVHVVFIFGCYSRRE